MSAEVCIDTAAKRAYGSEKTQVLDDE